MTGGTPVPHFLFLAPSTSLCYDRSIPMLRAVAVTELSAEPDAFQTQWSKLASSCPAATVFQTPEWLVSWWHELGRFAQFRSLYIVAVYDDDELIGVAPLVKSGWYGLPIKRLSFMGAGVSDYTDFIVKSGFETLACPEMYKFLLSNLNWNMLDFRELREGSIAKTYLPQLNSPLKFSQWPLEICPYLELPTEGIPGENWASLMKRYSKKTRANINYYDRTLGKTFEVEHSLASTDHEIEEAFGHLFDLHARRWNERWLPGVFTNKRVQAFHLRVGKALLKIDALRLRQIKLDTECVAVLYGFAYNGRSSYYQGGFEPSLGKYSLGSVLIARAIRGAIDEGHSIFDFLRGKEAYKSRWTMDRYAVNSRVLIARSISILNLAESVHKFEQAIEVNAKKAFASGLVKKRRRTQDSEE